jgi:ubiquinone/menaquinone biosynthesis C-methylase UbiE
LSEINIHQTESHHMATDLQTLNDAINYRRMLYSHIVGIVGTRIIEIGSGIGNYTDMLLEHGTVWATDIEDQYVEYLSHKFTNRANCEVSLMRLGGLSTAELQAIHEFSPDTFVCMNVLEHIENHELALQEMISCLTIGGHVAVIVPALPALFCDLDRKYGHFRRYTQQTVRQLVSSLQNAELVHCRYFNFPGIFGWWFNHVLLKRDGLPKNQTAVYDKIIVPIINHLEKFMIPSLGLSIVFWVRKTA